MTHELEERLRLAIAARDAARVPDLARQAAEAARNRDETAFWMTQSWVWGLEAGGGAAAPAEAWLKAQGRA